MALTGVRRLWFDTGKAAVSFAGHPEVVARWTDPSSLPAMTVGVVAGHLLHSGVLMVEDSLNAAVPEGDPLTAALLLSLVPVDASDAAHENVRFMSKAQVEHGPDELLKRASQSLDRLSVRLDATRPEDVVAFVPVPLLSFPMTLDELLRSRILELVVHVDDLAVSVGVDALPVPDAAISLACNVGVDINIHRYGGPLVVRALFRRDRSSLDPLRTF
jgi:Mycothiol maleylpyruvate isomerase N-terminal domain